MVKALLYISLVISACWAQEVQKQDYSQICQELLNYVYKETTLSNLNLSIKRLNIKLALTYAHSIEEIDKKKVNLRKNDELRFLLLNTVKLNPSFKSYLSKTKSYSKFRRWRFLYNDEKKDLSFSQLILSWKEYADKHQGKKALFSHFDLKNLSLIENINNINIDDSKLRKSLEVLASDLAKSLRDLSSSPNSIRSQILKLENELKEIDNKINASSKDLYQKYVNDYSDYCDEEMMNKLISKDNYICPFIKASEPVLIDQMFDDIYSVLNQIGIEEIQLPAKPELPKPIPPKPVSVIKEVEYKNLNYKGSFCKRSLKMVDTVVLHHTMTSYSESAQDINDSQVLEHEDDVSSNGSPDPWYMVAYNYLITTSGYDSDSEVTVNQGRPDIIRGAHAGGNISVKSISPKAKKELLKFDFQCGYNKEKTKDHSFSQRLKGTENYYRRQIRDGFVNANFTTVGVALVGNYAPYKNRGRKNIGGYLGSEIRYPTQSVIDNTAKLICELKKTKYPNLAKISDHNYIKIQKDLAEGNSTSGTCCPGTLYKRMTNVLEAVKKQCPAEAVNLKLDISPGTKVCSFLKKL